MASATDDDCPELEPTEQERRALVVAEAEHVHSTDEKDEILHVDASAEVIEINNLRIFSVAELQMDRFTKCRVLELRKNLIHELIVFPDVLRRGLDTLDLFDNKIKRIGPFFSRGTSDVFMQSKLAVAPAAAPADEESTAASATAAPQAAITTCEWHALRKLDLSYNQIRVIRGLDDLSGTLEELYLVENQIKKVEGLEKLTRLKCLELGGNQIRTIPTDAFATLGSLEQLWLGKNKINSLAGNLFRGLTSLKRLSLQANRLTHVADDAFPPGVCPALEELYLSENGLPRVHGIKHLKSLVLLDVSMNPIPSLVAVPDAGAAGEAAVGVDATADGELTPTNFPKLDEFWITDAGLSDWRELELVLAPFKDTLRTVYLERTPLERDRRYRDRVFQALPFVTQIDSWPVVNRDNLEADRAIRR